MPRFLDRTPFPDQPGELAVRDERVRVRANQIIAWVTLTLRRVTDPNPSAIPFPVILDTGHTHSFSIHERHLADWAGLRPETLAVLAAVRDRGQRILLREANVWVHPNERGSREVSDATAHLIDAPKGIAVYPGGEFPRLPILGLRVIADNDLVLKVNGTAREATLRTPIRWWPFG